MYNNNMTKKAGAYGIEDRLLGVYFGDQTPEGVNKEVQLNLMNELESNLLSHAHMGFTYPQLEETFVNYGYSVPMIRKAFEKVFGVNPVKLLHMLDTIMLNTPSSIPVYNYGWGVSKKKNDGFYFVLKDYDDLYTIFHQKNEIDREVVVKEISHKVIMKKLESLVKHVYRYDVPYSEYKEEDKNLEDSYEEIMEAMVGFGKTKTAYVVVQNFLKEAISNGKITEGQAREAIRVYAKESKEKDVVSDTPGHEEDTPEEKENIKDREKDIVNDSVAEHLSKKTPQQFFDSSVSKSDDFAYYHVRDIVSFINSKQSEIKGFDISIKRFVYDKYDDTDNTVTVVNSNTNNSSPLASISVIFEITNLAASDVNSKKFGLAVFFINPDNKIKTSDSFKGEDDLVYGFTSEGINKYFGL